MTHLLPRGDTHATVDAYCANSMSIPFDRFALGVAGTLARVRPHQAVLRQDHDLASGNGSRRPLARRSRALNVSMDNSFTLKQPLHGP